MTKILNVLSSIIKKVFQWLVYSSANPQKFALSLKAGFVFLAFLGFDKYITPDQSESIIDSVVIILSAIGTLIAGSMTITGAVRKIWLTIFPEK